MLSRRDFLQMSMAAAALTGVAGFGNWARLAAQDRFDQDSLLEFDKYGNITLMHVTDVHAQMVPIHYREPEVHLGVGAERDQVPHLTGEAFRMRYGVGGRNPLDYALTYEDFVSLAAAYGKVGGLDRLATVVNAIRADRPDALLLDGGDSWQGSWGSLRTEGQDMINVMNLIRPDAMTFHWEFTYGSARMQAHVADLPFAALGQNVKVAGTGAAPDFLQPFAYFERGGVKIAVIGQAFPHMSAAHPPALFLDLAFGVREAEMQSTVDRVRGEGAALVVLLSHAGFGADRKMAGRVRGIDVILSGHSHDALPEPVLVEATHIVASGSHGKFVSRIDLDVQDGRLAGLRHRLIPIFADLITPDPVVAAGIKAERAPFEAALSQVVGTAETLLHRRGTFSATWDDLIADALLAERDAEIALSPGFRWGPSVLPGQDITCEDIFNVTAIPYPQAYRTEMTGEMIKDRLEAAADATFHPDPYLRHGTDMLRTGGLGFRIDVDRPRGQRISDLIMHDTWERIEPARSYVVAGWGAADGLRDGPPIWDVLADHIGRQDSAVAARGDSVLPERPD